MKIISQFKPSANVHIFKDHIFSVVQKECVFTVHIRQLSGTHVWTVVIDAPANISRKELCSAALQAYYDGKEFIDM